MTTPSGGIAWTAKIFKQFGLAVPPMLGFVETPQSMDGFGLSVAPDLSFTAESSVSTASFGLSVPPQMVMQTPQGSFGLSVPPNLDFIGAESYASSFGLSVPPDLNFVGAERYSSSFGLSLPPDLNFTGAVPFTPFTPFNVENTNVAGGLAPAGASGCWVTLVGPSGRGGSCSGSSTTTRGGGGGAGGGARVDRVFIPASVAGSATYSVTQGTPGTASSFTWGSVTLTANSGANGTSVTSTTGGAGGAGGTATASGITATTHTGGNGGNGGAGTTAGSAGQSVTNGQGAGGGGGGGVSGTGGTGGNGAGGTSTGGNGGKGGNGGNGGSSAFYTGAAGSIYGGGPGGAGAQNNNSVTAATGGTVGYSLVEWVGSAFGLSVAPDLSFTAESSVSTASFGLSVPPDLNFTGTGQAAVASIVFDSAGAGGTVSTTGSSSATATWTQSIAADANMAFAVLGVYATYPPSNLSVTCGGVAMTQVTVTSLDVYTNFYVYKLASPPTGSSVAFNVTSVGSGNAGIVGDSLTYKGVGSLGTATAISGTGTAASQSISGTAGSALVFQCFCARQAGTISAYSGTKRMSYQSAATGALPMIAGDVPGSASLSFTATVPSGAWAGTAIPLQL